MHTLDKTQPSRPPNLETFQPVRITRRGSDKRWRFHFWLVLLGAILLVYFFVPFRTNILLLGTDDSPQRGALGRTDTIILTTIVPLKPYVGLLSIPRDLWVTIPNVGEQRINTAYFFAEAQQDGSGPRSIMETIRQDFGVTVHYYALIHMGGLVGVIDALGGVDIQLEKPLGGLPAGAHHLDGAAALAFARERYSADDFLRMVQGQILLQAVLKKMLSPGSWPRLPSVAAALSKVVQSNIPAWQWPRLSFALLRAFWVGMDSRTISREMVTPFTTSGGAQVLAPKWEVIRPLVKEMFNP